MRPQRGSPATRPPGCLGWTCPLLGCSTRLRGGPTPLRSPRGAVLTPSSAHANTLSVRTVNAQAHSYIYACIMHTHMYMSRRRCHQLRQLPQHGARSALEPAHAPLPHQPEPAWDDRRDHVAARRAGRQHRAAGTRTHARAMQAHAGTCRHMHAGPPPPPLPPLPPPPQINTSRGEIAYNVVDISDAEGAKGAEGAEATLAALHRLEGVALPG